MKKKKIDFEAEFWNGHTKHSCLTLIDAFFKMDYLSEVKGMLADVISYSTKPKVLLKSNPSLIFHFYLCMRSFLRASYVLQLNTKKWKLNDPAEFTSRLLQGSLSDEEYCDPFLVFRKAFKVFSLKDFDLFLTEIIYHSLGAHYDEPEVNIINPFIHLTKMLDAAQIRGIEKIKK
ncbi:hypothetical protein NAL32_21615 [Chryseobacterium sp. Ch-15]|uniref:Uncharacterized protein n=1 Tax=Chryseobacterium muglaense TaxID=2893752 RepID=A0A9Q3UTK0_9FLAO|nr:hypothetical protein [Chryseobacterium muglaense]MBD3907104.1 hypothetical protein [Chryseobacterium muglaense]MCC9033119.1 hypothetical protein [Chryseobacterium muglaense]MCM2556988.1 hypothetical protein [Chryseobacterium muglaense]